jgi:hypothetical protein
VTAKQRNPTRLRTFCDAIPPMTGSACSITVSTRACDTPSSPPAGLALFHNVIVVRYCRASKHIQLTTLLLCVKTHPVDDS